jgi:hypothetical protein
MLSAVETVNFPGIKLPVIVKETPSRLNVARDRGLWGAILAAIVPGTTPTKKEVEIKRAITICMSMYLPLRVLPRRSGSLKSVCGMNPSFHKKSIGSSEWLPF